MKWNEIIEMDKSAELNQLIADHDLVAHYTSKCKAIEHILPKQEIKFSSLGKTNDPYEFKAHWFGELGSLVPRSDQQNENPSECDIANQKYSEIKNCVTKQIKIFCTTKNSANPFENYLLPSMWAHYGEKHGGVCLLFSKKELSNCLTKYQTSYYGDVEKIEVNYEEFWHSRDYDCAASTQIEPESLDDYVNDKGKLFEHLKNHNFLDYLGRKHPNWQQENEHRWLVFSKNADDFFIDYGDALKAVVLGCEFPLLNHFLDPTPDLSAICTKLKGTDTQLFKLTHERGNFCVSDVARERYENN